MVKILIYRRKDMNSKIFSGAWDKCHCQGIAVDPKRGYIYYSFTTKLVKSDLNGNIIGTVENIIGHLGCIDFNDKDGKVYASLEYKNDCIGRWIFNALGHEGNIKNGFYVAIFDVDRIDQMGMDAEGDGIMRTVYLKTVVDDYEGSVTVGDKICEHIHGCSGIDGLAFGPDFGSKDKKSYLHVCYGIYSDVERSDNDYQVILQYDADTWWESLAKPMSQSSFHTSGPKVPRNKFFVYTGNTNFGIQNFEYDAYTGDYFACVYNGKKSGFPNYPMFVIDGSIAAREEALKGYDAQYKGQVLTLQKTGLEQNGISGMEFALGSTGFYSFGDGRFYVSENYVTEDGAQATNVCMYRLETNDGKWKFLRDE